MIRAAAVLCALALAGCGAPAVTASPATSTADHVEDGVFTAGGVDVTVSAGPDALTATLRPTRPGFHVYSLDMPDGGVQGLGIPTRLSVSGGLAAAGPVSADRPTRQPRCRRLASRCPSIPTARSSSPCPSAGSGPRPRRPCCPTGRAARGRA